MPVNWRGGASLAACAAALLAVACSTAPLRSPAQRAADEALADAIYTTLNDDPLYFYRHVDVSVRDDVAELSGYVWSAEALYHARQIALNVPGVRRVATSHLELAGQGSRAGAR
jgi:osmotically-inducible protein OsmY